MNTCAQVPTIHCHAAHIASIPNAFPCRLWAHWTTAPCRCFVLVAQLPHGDSPAPAKNWFNIFTSGQDILEDDPKT